MAEPAPDAWELIETALSPRADGRDILVTVNGERELVARWSGDAWVVLDSIAVIPTHWQDLPPPPKKLLLAASI